MLHNVKEKIRVLSGIALIILYSCGQQVAGGSQGKPQRGELEWEGGNLYFDQWSWLLDAERVGGNRILNLFEGLTLCYLNSLCLTGFWEGTSPLITRMNTD